MAACRKPWSGHVKLAGFSRFALPRVPRVPQHAQTAHAQICASRELQRDDRVECYVERHAGVQGGEFVERCRAYAAKCVIISRNISDPAEKLVLLAMAQSWLKLAEQAAAGAETVVMYESAVLGTPQRD
jgi:hypothetical protein